MLANRSSWRNLEGVIFITHYYRREVCQGLGHVRAHALLIPLFLSFIPLAHAATYASPVRWIPAKLERT